jgi:hypothetical protein
LSAETNKKFLEALTEHVADEFDGSFLTGFVLYLTHQKIDTPGVTGYSYFLQEDQPFVMSLGMAEMLKKALDQEWSEGQDL